MVVNTLQRYSYVIFWDHNLSTRHKYNVLYIQYMFTRFVLELNIYSLIVILLLSQLATEQHEVKYKT